MTAEQTNRVNRAIEETKRTLARATAYSSKHQDKDLIDFCTAHIAKLEGMLTQ